MIAIRARHCDALIAAALGSTAEATRSQAALRRRTSAGRFFRRPVEEILAGAGPHFRRLRRPVWNLGPFHGPGPNDVRMTSLIHSVPFSTKFMPDRMPTQACFSDTISIR